MAESILESLRSADWRPLLVSLRVGVISTIVSMAAGAALAFFASHRTSRRRRVFDAFVLLPLVLPPTVLGYFLLVILGARGPVGRAWQSLFGEPLVFTVKAAVIAACASAIPIITRQLTAAFSDLNADVTEAARIDGAHGWSMFAYVFLPQVRGALGAAAAIAFARSVGDFGATLMVAGNIPGHTQTAAIAIYDLMSAGKDREAFLMAGAVCLIALVVLVAVSLRGDSSSQKA